MTIKFSDLEKKYIRSSFEPRNISIEFDNDEQIIHLTKKHKPPSKSNMSYEDVKKSFDIFKK